MPTFRIDKPLTFQPVDNTGSIHWIWQLQQLKERLRGAYLMRSGDSLVPMSEDQLRRIFAEGKPDWVEEHTKTAVDAQEIVDLLD